VSIWVRLTWTAAAVTTVVFLIVAAAGSDDESVLVPLFAAIAALVTAACLMRAARDRATRVPWLLLAGALAGFGYTAAAYLADAGSPADFPSTADIGSLGYLLAGAAFVVVSRRELTGLPRALWLDAAIGGLALAAVATAIVHDGIAGGAEASTAERGQLLYLSADMVLAGFVFVAWGLGGFRRTPLLLLGIGAVVMGVSDAIYTARIFEGHPDWPPLLAAMWGLSFVAMAGATVVGAGPRRRRRLRRWSLVAVPVTAALVAVVVHMSDHGHSTVSTYLATAVLVLAVVRMAMSLIDNQRAEEVRRRQDEIRRESEEAERANRAKTEFLSRMSHEVRTPLNSILGFAQLLVDDVDGSERESVERILRAGNHLRELIDDILDLSTIEAGETAIAIEPVPLGPAVDESVALLEPLARRGSVRVVRRDAEDAPAAVLADPGRLNQVLLNLISNAIKYGGAESEVVVRSERVGNEARISVIDSGPGIPDEDRAKLFLPFERGSARGSGVEGSGLGLALANNLVERMHGQIDFETGPGGSTFWVTLPVSDAVVVEALVPREEGRAEETAAGTMTLLYIEDHVSNIALVERLLARRGDYGLITATTGRAGLKLAGELLPDAVLLDLDLPDIRGEDVMRQLRADPATDRIPVIVVSADATSWRRDELIAAGAAAYIVKPLQLASFLGTLDAVLRQQAPHS
jgi:signal transduction histidine kinase/ActR/RegA family two-component response regulator